MNHFYIHCPALPPEDYRLVLERLCGNSVQNITVYTQMPSSGVCDYLQALVQVQKEHRPENTVRFRNYAVFRQLPPLSKALCRTLRKHSFCVELMVQPQQAPELVSIAKTLERNHLSYHFWVDETADQTAVYHQFAKHGLHICFTKPRYSAESPTFFSKWLYDPAARGINTFSDIINMLTLQTHSPNCRHASCFGSTFRVDENLTVYLCPHCAEERTKLGSLHQVRSVDQLLNCDAVAKLLPEAIQKRGQCADSCSAFAYCQGGCLLESDPDCVHYNATVEHIRLQLLEVYASGDLRKVNYIARNAILNALAFGTAFFDQRLS